MILVKMTKECDLYSQIYGWIKTDIENYKNYEESLERDLPKFDKAILERSFFNARGEFKAFHFLEVPDKRFKPYMTKEYDGLYTYNHSKAGKELAKNHQYKGDKFNFQAVHDIFGADVMGKFTIPKGVIVNEIVYMMLDFKLYDLVFKHDGVSELTRHQFEEETGYEIEN